MDTVERRVSAISEGAKVQQKKKRRGAPVADAVQEPPKKQKSAEIQPERRGSVCATQTPEITEADLHIKR